MNRPIYRLRVWLRRLRRDLRITRRFGRRVSLIILEPNGDGDFVRVDEDPVTEAAVRNAKREGRET